MVSNASSNFAGIGLSTESTSGSGLAITYNTSGLSLGIPAWITTGGAGGGVAIAASGSTETDSTVIFSNSNGVSFGLSDYTMTAQIAGVGSVNFSDGSGISWGSSVNGVSSTITGSIQQSYVLSGNNSNTTAFTAGSALTLIASDNVTIGANSDNQIYIKAGGGGDKQWTVASTNAGTDLSVSTGAATNTIYYPAWLTTYTPGAGGGEWSVVTTNAGTDIIISTATNTNTLYHPAFITTAAASNHTHSDLYIAKGDSTYYQSSNLSSVFQTTGAYLTTAAQSVHTHDYQSTGAYLTTQRDQVVSASNGSYTFETIKFGSSIVTFFTNASGIQGSYSQSTHPHDYLLTANSSLLQHTSATSAITASALNTSVSGSFQLTANNSLSLDTGYTTHTHLYQSTGAYLTTAMVSNASSNFAGIGLSTESTSGSGLAITYNTSGLSLGIPAWITTGGAGGGVAIAASGSTETDSTVIFSNSNGVSFGLSDYTMTAQIAGVGSVNFSDGSGISWGSSVNGVSSTITGSIQQSYVLSGNNSNTTAFTAGSALTLIASDNVTIGANSDNQIYIKAGGGGDKQWTVASTNAGTDLSVSTGAATNTIYYPAWLTTYTPGAGGGEWSVVTTNAGTDIIISTATNTNTLYHPAFITTAAASNHTHSDLYIAKGDSTYYQSSNLSSVFQTTGAYLTTAAQSVHTHDYQSTGAYLTTQRDQVVSASNGSYTFETIKFGSSIVTFFTNASGIQGSYSQSTHPHDYLLTANSSLLQHTSATSAITASALNTSVSGSFQLTANNSLSLDTGYTTHTHLYQSTGAYLTTAMVSNASSNFAGIGLSTESTSGSGLAITYNTSGLSLGIPAWITTGGAGGGVAIAASGSTETDSTVIFSNSNGVSFGLSDYTMTAQIAGVGSVNFSDGSGISWGSSVNGVSSTITGSIQQSYVLSGNNSNTTAFTAGSALTLIASDNVTIGANSDNQIYIKAGGGGDKQWTVASTNAGTDLSVSTGAATNTIYYPAWLTTYTPGAGGGEWSVVTTNAGTDIIISTATNTNTLYHPAFITTAAASNHTHSDLYIAKGDSTYYQSSNLSSVFQTTGAYLTTAMVSNASSNFAGIGLSTESTSGSGLAITYNTSGLSLGIPAWITTGGAGGGVAIAASGSTETDSTVIFSNSNGVSFGLSDYTMTAQIAGVGSVNFSDGSGISWGSSVNGVSSTITGSIQQSYVLSGNNSNTTAFTAGSALTLIASDNVTIGANSDNQIYIKAGGGGDKQWTVASTNAGTDLSVSTGAATNTIYYPAWLTTYTPGAGGGEWSVVTTNAGTDIIISTATNTNTLYHPAFITTAAASNHTHSDLYINTSLSGGFPINFR